MFYGRAGDNFQPEPENPPIWPSLLIVTDAGEVDVDALRNTGIYPFHCS